MVNVEAVFSDGTEMFRSPCEPEPYDTVTVRLRAGKDDFQEVSVLVNGEQIRMNKEKSEGVFDWYAADIKLTDKVVTYYFCMCPGEEKWFYDSKGMTRDSRNESRFRITPGFHTPAWAKGAVMYQIFVDRFCNGDPGNDVQTNEYYYIGQPVTHVNDWNRYPGKMDVQAFYGGDLQGVKKKLPYLKDLGVEVIYLNPVFVSPSNHKYDTQDYDYVDPHYGVILEDDPNGLPEGDTENAHSAQYVTRVTSLKNLEASNQFFAELIAEIHALGMRVILDGVFNHCGSFNKWLDHEKIYSDAVGFEKGAYLTKDSPYNSFFDFRENAWPDNESYDGWWGYKTLPKLNYEQSGKLYDYIMHVGRKWVSPPFCADGWRLDVAADLGHSLEFNHKFWKDFRKNVRGANKDALILAEHYGDAGDWLKGDEWDSVMNYDAFMEPVTWFLTGMQKHSDESKPELIGDDVAFVQAMQFFMGRFQTASLQTAMNELSNHDHSRFLTRTNRTVGRTATKGPEAANMGVNHAVMREAVMIQMTWPGAPTIYYGDEAGLCGWTDPDNRRAYPWGREDHEMIAYHKEVIQIHKSYEVLKTGSLVILKTARNLLSYARMNEQDSVIVAINNAPNQQAIDIPVWKAGIGENQPLVRLLYTNQGGFFPDSKLYYTTEGHIRLWMPAESGIILKNCVTSYGAKK